MGQRLSDSSFCLNDSSPLLPLLSQVRRKLVPCVTMLSLWLYMFFSCSDSCVSVRGLVLPGTMPNLPAESPISITSTLAPDPIDPKILFGLPQAPSTVAKVEKQEETGRIFVDSATTTSSFFDASANKKLPQAIIIGVKKGGTRALLEFLRVHPDVRALGTEPHFFDRSYDKGLTWYRDLMPRSLEGQITMEKTPSYFVTKEAPARISAMSKDTKLIAVVRDPVTRAISDYTQTLSKCPDIPTFESLTFKNRTAGLIDTSWNAIQIGIYAKHLENWLLYFPISQILFVSGERLIRDPAGELGRVQDFLGLKRVITNKNFYFNKTKGFPCLKKSESNSKSHCLGKNKGRTHPNINQEVVQRLREFYKPFNMKFYQMTGHDFGWD